jgi:RNA-directed DNA polymerase
VTRISIGLQELRKRIGEQAKADPHHRFWGIYTHVWKLDTLEEAYRLAKENNGAPGVDGVKFEQIEAKGLPEFLATLSEELREKSYRPLPCRRVDIPKDGGKVRQLRIPAIRDRVVQGALKLILEPIFEEDFQEGSFGYRPNRTAHQALERVRWGLNHGLHNVIDLDLKSYFDSVRHDLLLSKLAKRIQDGDILWLSKSILKSGGKRGVPQGSVIGPLWSNVFLNEVDRMLEQAQKATREEQHDVVQYTRFADDLVVLVSSEEQARHWVEKVVKRLREELEKLALNINEDKSGVRNFEAGEPFDFLGYSFRWVNQRNRSGRKMVLARPQKKRKERFLRELQSTLKKCLSRPVEDVVKRIVNPRAQGWVNYFRWGNAARDLIMVRWHVEQKVRRFASRQRPKRRGGRTWSSWSENDLYGRWGLFNAYVVRQ